LLVARGQFQLVNVLKLKFAMKVLGPQDVPDPAICDGVVAIGNFDGLHRGHQKLLALTVERARQTEKPCGLLTFEPHPRSFFKPDEPVFRLTPPALKQRLAQHLGLDFMYVLPFDASLSNASAEEFIATHLVEKLAASHLFTGYDFHFGKGRKGNAELLRNMGQNHGFGVTVVEQVTDDDGHAPFASSSIRSALRRGNVTGAARELGYDWTVMGEVVHGDKRGRTIGFPTANIILDAGAEPYRGIYAVEVRDAAAPAGSKAWMGAAYFGDRPTFNTNRTFLEVYLLDQDIDLYGRTLMISFIDMVRGDKTFKSVDDLVVQMKADCETVREILQARVANTDSHLAVLQAAGRL
jgi:riboflavin kinase / FMN adenylyltransferase